MPWRLGRSSTKKRGLGGLAAAADVEGVDDVGEAEPDRGLGELRALQVTAVAGPSGVQEPALGRRALPVLDLQVLAKAGRVRTASSGSGTKVCCRAASSLRLPHLILFQHGAP